MYCNRLSDKICISVTNVDVICYCLHLNINNLIRCIAKCLETSHALHVASMYCKTGNQLPRWPNGIGVRLERKGSLVGIQIPNFDLLPGTHAIGYLGFFYKPSLPRHRFGCFQPPYHQRWTHSCFTGSGNQILHGTRYTTEGFSQRWVDWENGLQWRSTFM